MQHNKIIATSTGVGFVLLGILLLATLVDALDSSTIYGWVVPVVLVFGGLTTLQESPRYKKGVGYGLIAIGAVTLLVRLDLIRGDVVNALLGAVLLAAGVSILARSSQKKVEKE